MISRRRQTVGEMLSEAAHNVLSAHLGAVQQWVPDHAGLAHVFSLSLPNALCELGKLTASLLSNPAVVVQMGQPLLQDLVVALHEDPYKQMHAESVLRCLRREPDTGAKAALLARTFIQLAA